MAIIRWHRTEPAGWSPFRQLSLLRNEIDRLFETPLDSLTTNSQQLLNGWLPPVDLLDAGENLVLRVEVPGMRKEDLDISLHGDLLTLAGERKETDECSKAEPYRTERCLGRFQRTFTLPVMVDPQKVEASYCDGILTVTLPKAEEAKPKQIEVKVQ